MTNPINSSSSSSVSSALSNSLTDFDSSKKRPIAALTDSNPAINEPTSSSKRPKTESDDSIKKEMQKTLSDASAVWNQRNNSAISAALQPVLQSPLTEIQRELVMQLIKTSRTADPSQTKEEAEIGQYNLDLYQKFNEIASKGDAQKSSLKLLAQAIKGRQLDLISMLLPTVSLTEDDDETYQCVLNASQSRPEIACLVLAKKPRLDFSRSNETLMASRFYLLALFYQHERLFTTMLQIWPGIHKNLVTPLLKALKDKSILTNQILKIPHLNIIPEFCWYVIESDSKDLMPSITKESFHESLQHAIRSNKISLPLNDNDKKHIQQLCALGVDLNNTESLRDLVRRVSSQDHKAIVDSLLWLMTIGVDFLKGGYYSLINEMGEDLRVAFLRELPRSYSSAKEAFQMSFECCDDSHFMQVQEIANSYSDDLIDWQKALNYAVESGNIERQKSKVDFLKSKGAKLFGKNGEIFFKGCLHFRQVSHFRKEPDYSKILFTKDQNGFGVLSHLFVGSRHHVDGLKVIDEVCDDLLKTPQIETKINRQDLFSAYLLLISNKFSPPANLIKLVSRFIKEATYSQLEGWHQGLIRWVDSYEERLSEAFFNCDENSEEHLDKSYNEFIRNNEHLKFNCGRHIPAAVLSSSLLTDSQKKEITSIDPYSLIDQLVEIVNFPTDNAKILKEFFSLVRERRAHAFTSDLAFLNPFEKSCRAIIPRANYTKIIGSLPAYLEHDAVADRSSEQTLKSLKDILDQKGPKELLRKSVIGQIVSEHAYLMFEDMLRVILYHYSPGKGDINIEAVKQILNTLVSISSQPFPTYMEKLHPFEAGSLAKITGKPFRLYTIIEYRIHLTLIVSRLRLLIEWAKLWTGKKAKNLTQAELQKAEYGLEIHYFLAALKHAGTSLGIPCAEITEDSLVKWTPEMDRSLKSSVAAAYLSPSKIVAELDFHKKEIVDEITHLFMSDWKKEEYSAIKTEVLSEIEQILKSQSQKFDAIMKNHSENIQQREKELEETYFAPIREVFSKRKLLFYEQALKQAIVSGKSYTHMKSSLEKISDDAVLNSRHAEYGRSICDKKGEIKPSFMRAFLLRNKIIEEHIFTGELNL